MAIYGHDAQGAPCEFCGTTVGTVIEPRFGYVHCSAHDHMTGGPLKAGQRVPPNSSLPTDYQTYIHASRYARFRDDLGRREHWGETVTRYFDYFEEDLERRHGYRVPPTLRSELHDAVSGLHVMTSMRALMTAGEAARRENLAIYNCAYVAIDRPRAFAEILYILMCGTGVGFSVERQYINLLPEVPSDFSQTAFDIIVGDSKRGWAEAFEALLTCLYAGTVPHIIYDEVRPAGERLKVFGGRASGPEPLQRMFEFTIRTFRNAAGRRLNSLECHEIATMTGDIVVVGGVRRAAEISLSNLSDQRMRDAKSGDWRAVKPHLELANNSVAYTETPDVGAFMTEWLSIYKSMSGERGMFNRIGAQRKVLRGGRRDHRHDFGVNPCGEIILRSRGLCNLSEAVVRESDGMAELREKVRLASILGTWQATQTTFQFVEPDWAANAEEERLLGVSLTGIYDNAFMRGDAGFGKLARGLHDLRATVVAANRELSYEIGISPSVATTTVKPSGTVSQLVNSPSGIHQGHAPYYIRRVASDNKDPVTQFMADAGIPHEPHASKPDAMTVFSFPIALSPRTVTREDVTAIQHLELAKLYNQNWSEHAVSCTISIKESEWPTVGGWVYDNFDDLVGMSFLPYFGEDTTYTQLPYETIDKRRYDDMLAAMPASIDWTKLADYEQGEDSVTGTREFACQGNSCEIVDSVKPL